MTDKLFHFVSLVFYNDLIFNLLSRNLVSSVSFVSHFRETNTLANYLRPGIIYRRHITI
jgi:hypothetical protein